ncbi:hypothetical protein BC628DRAFT_1359258 [Trametes gibbosa]|nr:hypothetical protein BC628DRAFT_1359258 [Trametes gibbosa]
MPADVQTIPQLPPIPPQTPFVADHYPWERHYPPSSWPASIPSVVPGRSKSTSPNTQLRTLPIPLLSGTSFIAEVIIPSPRSQSRSHSRSGSRVPVLPSASTAEPIVISPPARTHSRSASAVMSKLPPRPPVLDPPTVRSHTRSKSRPLPLPIPPKDPLQSADSLLSRSESLSISKTNPNPVPAATQPVRIHAGPLHQLPRRNEAAIPMSAPVHQVESSHSLAHPRPRPIFEASQSQPHLPLDTPPPIPASVPVRAPTPPRPKARPGLPATPRRQDDRRGVERGRSTQAAAVTVQSSPKPRGLDSVPNTWGQQPNDQFARKWVLEKNGKRLTQDSMVVAQQLRLLR